MPQHKLLIDSNVYFRLARDIHPLLFQTFGKDQHCLYVLKELQDEFDNNHRLQRKFPWVDDDSYRRNRRKTLQVGNTERRLIEQGYWLELRDFPTGFNSDYRRIFGKRPPV